MSNEYTLHSNFQRFSDDPRAKAEYEYRMARVHRAEDELLRLQEEAAERYSRRLRAAAEEAERSAPFPRLDQTGETDG